MNYQLLVLDIDGTVTNSDKEVLKKTREEIIRIQKQGIRVVLASGRPPEGVYPVAEELGFQEFGSYVLAFNGARIIDYKKRQCIFEKRLPRHIPVSLWKDALKNKIGFAAYQDGVIVAGTEPDAYMEAESRISGMPIKYHERFEGCSDLVVNECLLTGPSEDLEAVEPMFAWKYLHEAQVFHSEPHFLEVTPKNVDKAYGLKHMLKLLGISREAMVCCGDSFNDIAMLQYAGVGVAMANAAEEVKMIADYVTVKDNDNDGIAEVIGRYF